MAASVILAKCGTNNRTYGIRVEKRGNDWVSTWAFPIDDGKAKREGFDKTKIKGAFTPVDGYPGCPYCGSNELAQCGCGKMFCYKEDRASAKSENRSERKPERKTEERASDFTIRCPWCGHTSKEIETVESFTVKSGSF